MRMLAAVLPLLLLQGAPPALAAPPEAKRVWDFAPYSSVRRVPAEPGAAANDQPVTADYEGLRQALESVRLVSPRAEEPLFIAKEAALIARALVEALAIARPGEDLALVSTHKRETALLAAPTAVTARVFVQQGRLNLVVHDARLDYMERFTVETTMPEFTFGSRTKAGAVLLKAPGAASRRADWVVLPITAPAPPVPAAAAAAPAPPPSQLERLRRLQEARDQKLITEDEFARRKAELIKEF